MLILAELSEGDRLQLSAYSADKAELDTVSQVLEDCGGSGGYSPLPSDRWKRQGRQYEAAGEVLTALQQRLGVEFVGTGKRTSLKLGSGPVEYRCQEVSNSGDGKGCEDFAAADDSAARMKCALIAGAKRWLGGVASPGRC